LEKVSPKFMTKIIAGAPLAYSRRSDNNKEKSVCVRFMFNDSKNSRKNCIVKSDLIILKFNSIDRGNYIFPHTIYIEAPNTGKSRIFFLNHVDISFLFIFSRSWSNKPSEDVQAVFQV